MPEELSLAQEQLHRIKLWQAGVNPPPGPVTAMVFPTNICNIQCKHCWQRWKSYDKSYKSEMSDERFLSLVEEGRELGIRWWYFVGGGDPMGRRDLVMEMVRRIRAYGGNGGIHTNGTLFKPEHIEELVDLGWEQIRVSLDGPNAEINDYIRSKGFDKAVKNLRLFSEAKACKGAVKPDVHLYITVTNLTFDKIVDFVELAHSLGPDIGCLLSGLIVDEPGVAQFELSPEQKLAYPGHVREGLARARELAVDNNFEWYLSEELVRDGMDMHRDFKWRDLGGLSHAMCFEPFTNMSIVPDGMMGPCCAFEDADAMSLSEHSLAEVWNGPYMTRVRQGMLNGNPPHYCRRCPANLYVEKERNRVAFSPALERSWKDIAWQRRGAAARAGYLVERSVHSLREAGLSETMRRGARWLKLRMHGDD
ncbi:MAG: hypothetical protein RLZZ303_459 [Candidatus Hydrogenedentota bacterium]